MTFFSHSVSFALAALASGLLLCGCREASSQAGDQTPPPASAQKEETTAFIPQVILPQSGRNLPILKSLPKFELTDHRAQSVNLEQLYGKIWVVNFIHTECGELCELQTRLMDVVQNALRPQLGDAIRYVTVTVEPGQDTPDVLAKYVQERGLNTQQWHFLTGATSEISELVKTGFGITANDPALPAQSAIPRSSDLFLIDWEGRLRGQYPVIDQAAGAISQSAFNRFKSELETTYLEQKPLPESLHDFADPRQSRQIETASAQDIYTGFTFSDEIEASRIAFRHQIIDDLGTDYKAVHYDHGNGMAIADVDLDGLLDIYFTTLSGTNELWRNLGGGQFENITETAGLHVSDRIGMAASFADIDNDGDPDLYISNVRVGNLLFENDGTGHFTDITQSSGTDVKAHSSGAVFFDYDRDGLLDLFVTNVGVYTTDERRTTTLYSDKGQVTSPYEYYVGFKDAFAGHLKPERSETSILFRNLGDNRFEDVSAQTGLLDDSWSGDATIIDGNDDGWPDVYVLNMQGNDQYYENQKGRGFVRKSRDIFEQTPWGAMGAKAFDYDNDGDMDLYVTDMHSDMREYIDIDREKFKGNNTDPESFLRSGGNSIFGNAFYRNDGNGNYTEISDQIGLENYWPWGVSSGDLNADGFEDLFVASSMSYPFRYHINSVFLNNQGEGFIDSEYLLGVEPRRNNVISKPWFEIDCEGADKAHLVCVNSNTPIGGRTVVWGALGTRSSAIFDLDNDGDQDIVTLELNHLPMVLISDLSEQKDINYVQIKLTGTQSNRAGIGAVIKIYAGDDVYTKPNDGKSGYLGQSVAPVYFGLGAHREVEKIEVVWPSGVRQELTDGLDLGGVLEITEPLPR
jgi:cytochrome oxidase Cu insertion factor (SCO1/SenC/PrrC family)